MLSCGSLTIDWGAVATFAEVGAIIWAGWYAGSIARTQLSELNKNERVSNTLKLLDDFFRPISLIGFECSPMNGFHRMASLFWHKELMDRFMMAKVLVLAHEKMPETDYEDFYGSTQAAATVFSNYFVIIKGLLDENRLQEKLILEKVGYFARKGLEMLEELNFPAIELADLREIAALSLKYIPSIKVEEKVADA